MFSVQRVASGGSPGLPRLSHGRSLIAPVLGCGSGIGPDNFRLPLSTMRMTIVAYTGGQVEKVNFWQAAG
jgi:hypothetical protein